MDEALVSAVQLTHEKSFEVSQDFRTGSTKASRAGQNLNLSSQHLAPESLPVLADEVRLREPPDVSPVLHPIPLDFINRAVASIQCLVESNPGCSYAQDSPARSEQFSAF